MKKIVLIVAFIFAIISLNACKSTGGCVSVEKQEIDNNQTEVTLQAEVIT